MPYSGVWIAILSSLLMNFAWFGIWLMLPVTCKNQTYLFVIYFLFFLWQCASKRIERFFYCPLLSCFWWGSLSECFCFSLTAWNYKFIFLHYILICVGHLRGYRFCYYYLIVCKQKFLFSHLLLFVSPSYCLFFIMKVFLFFIVNSVGEGEERRQHWRTPLSICIDSVILLLRLF